LKSKNEYNLRPELLLIIHFGNGTNPLNHAHILCLNVYGGTLTAIISAECQTAAIVAGAIATTISSNLLDKRSPRIGAVIFGFLIWFAAFLIPDPNAPITNAPWPHNWIHVYCNHALLWVHADQAEEGCHPGPLLHRSLSH
jgi:hypothetical protein